MHRGRTLFACVLAALMSAAHALQVVDDRGVRIELPGPAQRIISLAPHITELLFAAGAGERIVGVVEYSNYPEAAKRLPRVGDTRSLDLERIIALRPDLVIVWLKGSPQTQLDVLTALRLPIYYNEPRVLDEIALTCAMNAARQQSLASSFTAEAAGAVAPHRGFRR